MNWKLLGTMVTLIGVGASVALGQGTTPTIVQGDYISNVFGNSNFVQNPNAKLNATTGVAVSSATVTRSTTTPLVATSEFLVTVTSANGTIAWNTRTFDQGMKGQNCEARFTYRGFQSTSVAQVRQGATVAGANVVARLALTATTDPRIASINFPCGDLSQPTYFVITDTATLSGTHEIGGAYIGLATNMANVAQAEEVGSYTVDGSANCDWTITSATLANFPADADCNTGVVTGLADTSAGKIPGVKFNNLRPGKYLFIASFPTTRTGGVADTTYTVLTDGTTKSNVLFNYINSIVDSYSGATHTLMLEYTTITSPTIQVQGSSGSASTTLRIPNNGSSYRFRITAYRFPSSSELVVTPERQNVFGGVQWPNNTNYTFATTSTTAADATNAAFASASATYFGGAKASATANVYGMKMENIPIGVYRISVKISTHNQSGTNDCTSELHDNSGMIGSSQSSIQNNSWNNGGKDIVAIYRVTSFQASQDFKVKLRSGNVATTCSINASNGGTMNPSIVFEPLDQPSNSALYVQGPVLGAQTGAAIPAGYVGEILKAEDAGFQTATSATYRTISLTLTPGVWDVQSNCNITRNGASWSDANLINSVTNQNSNPTEGYISHLNGLVPTNWAVPSRITRVRWDGTTNITEGNSNTSSPLVYSRCYPGVFTGGPVQLWQTITARRVN